MVSLRTNFAIEPTFSKGYMDAATAEVVAAKVREAARQFKELGSSADAAINSALILSNKEGVRREITSIESPDISNMVAAALAAMGQARSIS